VLLLVYGAGAVIGNFLGRWLSDKALMPSLTGLLVALAGALALFWLVSGHPALAAILTFVIGALAFAIIPGMQARVMATARTAPTLAVAVNASGFQLTAAFAGWLSGQVITSGLGLRSIYRVGAFLTVAGLAIAVYTLRRDRQPPPAPDAASSVTTRSPFNTNRYIGGAFPCGDHPSDGSSSWSTRPRRTSRQDRRRRSHSRTRPDGAVNRRASLVGVRLALRTRRWPGGEQDGVTS
jgi:MFS family permease